MKGRHFSDKEIIEGVKRNENEVLIFIYRELKPEIIQYILNKGGCKSDADEVFQITIIKIKQRLEDEKIRITSNFKSYLFKTTVSVWLKEIRSTVYEKNQFERYINEQDVAEVGDDDFGVRPSLRPMLSCFNLLQEDCQEIFIMQAEGLKYKQIAEELNLSQKYIKIKRKRCYEILLDSYKKTINDEPEQ